MNTLIARKLLICLCLVAMLCTLSISLSKKYFSGEDGASISELLHELSIKYPNLGYSRLIELDMSNKKSLNELGFLPHFLIFFEHFDKSQNPSEVEVKLSLLTKAKPNTSDSIQLHIKDKLIPAATVKDVTSKDVKKITGDEFFFVELVFFIPISKLQDVNSGDIILSSARGQCEILINDRIEVYKKLRMQAIESSEQAVELHIPLRSENIKISTKIDSP